MYVILRSIDEGDELIGQAELFAALAEEKTEKWSRTSLKLYCKSLTSHSQIYTLIGQTRFLSPSVALVRMDTMALS
jgi:hypothetical protein